MPSTSFDTTGSISNQLPVPSVAEPVMASTQDDENSSSSSSISEESASIQPRPSSDQLQRPKLGSRKSSGTLIVPRDSDVEIHDEEYAEGDARTMSPRRTSEEIEKLGEEAREALMEQAKTLQASLQSICERVVSIKTEHEKLEGENKFLQNYIGELMQTTKITSAGAPKSKGKARPVR